MAEETKSNETKKEAAAPAPRSGLTVTAPMSRLAARISFYLGILLLAMAIIQKFLIRDQEALPISPRAFGTGAVICILMTCAILLAEIERKFEKK
jgi:hypothetical protein